MEHHDAHTEVARAYGVALTPTIVVGDRKFSSEEILLDAILYFFLDLTLILCFPRTDKRHFVRRGRKAKGLKEEAGLPGKEGSPAFLILVWGWGDRGGMGKVNASQ